MATAKPFLRWAGSKRKQICRLRQFWRGNHVRYVEPFAGSACLFFAIQPTTALLADKNSQLIEAYEIIRESPEDVYDRVACLPRTERVYYAQRSRDPQHLTPIDRAIRFVYLNRNCFNGIYRTNGQGMFNVPFATSRAGAFVSRGEFVAAAQALNHAVLRPWDFGKTLRYVTKGDFVYLDPPYAVTSRRVFKEYGATPFCVSDLSRLAEHLKKINARCPCGKRV
ncbi:MAG: Dam family site-specific DNA-(adenine-N6)-methyltransferase [Thermoguttaceae bacterium]